MKGILVALPALSGAIALNHIDGVGIFHRHGARTGLDDWIFPLDDIQFDVGLGDLTAAGYHQAIQSGTRYYYRYLPYLEGIQFSQNSTHAIASSSVSPRAMETTLGFIEGWNRGSMHGSEFGSETRHHYSHGAIPKHANTTDNAHLMPMIRTDKSWFLKGSHERIEAAHQRCYQTDGYKKWHLDHQKELTELFEFAKFNDSTPCFTEKQKTGRPESASCTPLDFNLNNVGAFVSNFIVATFHSAKTAGWGNWRDIPPHLLEFMDTGVATEIRRSWCGRAKDLVFSALMLDLFKDTQTHALTGKKGEKSAPLLSMMGTHDSLMSAFMLGLGMEEKDLPSLFYADSIAIEITAGRTSEEAREFFAKVDPETFTAEGLTFTPYVRFLFNGAYPLRSAGKFSLVEGDLPLQYDLAEVLQFAKSVMDHPEEDELAYADEMQIRM